MNEYEKLATRLSIQVNWIETLIEVSDNDPDATQNWYIPALTLDYHGYMMEPFWDNEGSLNSNEEKNAYFQQYAQNIIDNLTIRVMAANMEISYEDYITNERGRPVQR